MSRWYAAPALVLLLSAALARPALAQAAQGQGPGFGWNGWGVRLGLSVDPDQVYGGFHFDLGEFAKNVRFRPNLEFGTGDDVTLIQANAEVEYVFSKVQVWKPYAGGSVGMSWVSVDEDLLPPGVDNTDTEVSLYALGGVETKLRSGTRFFLEGKLGLGDGDPDLKLAAGWTWK